MAEILSTILRTIKQIETKKICPASKCVGAPRFRAEIYVRARESNYIGVRGGVRIERKNLEEG